MKKLFSAIIAILVCVSASYAQKTHTLVSRVLEDYDDITYFYNEQGLLDSIYQEQFTDQWYITSESNVYNEKGQCILNNLFQKFDTGWKHNSYVEYVYNDKGLLVKRTNYNNFGGFSKQADLEYIYNEKDQLTTVNTLMDDWSDPEKHILLTREVYTYQNDLLASRVLESNTDPFGWNGGDPENPEFKSDAKSTYSYDVDNKLIAQQDYVFDANTGEEKEAGLVKFTYDAHGNVAQTDYYLRSENPSARNVYHYDTTVLKEKALLPHQYELEENEWARVMNMSSNIITEVEEWQVPVEVDELMYLGSYIWNYDVESGVGNNKFEQKAASLRCMVNNGLLKIDGAAVGSRIEVFTMEGRLVRQTRYTENGIAIGMLPSGAYIARVNGRAAVKFIYAR